jgi:hypothetical protein
MKRVELFMRKLRRALIEGQGARPALDTFPNPLFPAF